MDKNKLVKIVSVATGLVVIVCIIYFIMNGDWFDAVGLSAIFFGLWIMPTFLKKNK
tara:strand:- start:217 stop:384 length:168 start_codon:yes stop_codon:yes gene_type:complete